MNLPVSLLTLAACSAAAIAPSQVPSLAAGGPVVFEPGRTPIHTQADDPDGGAYGTWAGGTDYKVSFHDGATFVPYLGADYPHNQPFRWTTTAVTIGGESLMTQPEPEPRQAGDHRYEYDFGGVVETYDVRVDGLEQTFVVPRLPRAAGDLIVQGRVETLLTAKALVARHAAVEFVDHAGQPILSYGAATAVDADGRREPMRTTYRDGAFRLELSGSWLATAAFPVVVDPLIASNVTLNNGTAQSQVPQFFDVLRDDARATENVWICYTRSVSATDQDMWVMRTQDHLPGPLFVQAFADITTSWGNLSCSLAYAQQRVICAFTRDFAQTRNIRWHAHHINDLGNRTGYGIVQTVDNWRVDLGGNKAGSSQPRVMMVYQHETGLTSTFANTSYSEIHGAYLDFPSGTPTTGQGTLVDPVVIAASTTRDYERPRINQFSEGRSINEWAVVYQTYNYGVANDDWDVGFALYDHLGSQRALDFIENHNGRHKLGPIVEGSNGRYLVAYASADTRAVSYKTQTRVGYDLNAMRVDASPGRVAFPHGEQRYRSGSTRHFEVGGLAYDTSSTCHWLVVARAGRNQIVELLGYRGRSVTRDQLFAGSSEIIEYAGTACFDDDNDTFVVIGSTAVTGNNPLFGNLWRTPAIAAPTASGTTCSAAALGWSDSRGLIGPATQRIGYEYSGVRLTGAPAGSLCWLAISLAAANTPLTLPGVAGGCRLLIDNQAPNFIGFEDMTVANGLTMASWPLTVPEGLTPDLLYFQALHTDPTGSQLLSTQRLVVPLGY